MASRYILGEEIKTLVAGSYEQLLPRVHRALSEDRKRLFGVEEDITLLGTFKGYAVAATESGDVFRVHYETSQDGTIVPLTSEPVTVPKYTDAEFTKREAKKFVEAFLSGARTEASERFAVLVRHASEAAPTPVVAPSKVVETFEGLVKGERPWKQVYRTKLSEIREEIKSEVEKIDANRLRPKFKALYATESKVLAESNSAGYEALVTSDLKYLGERVKALESLVEGALTESRGSIPALKSAAMDPTVKTFESFAEDLISDLRGVRNYLSENCESLNLLDAKAKVYDVLASELHSYEVAANFVANMSRRLSEAAGKGN